MASQIKKIRPAPSQYNIIDNPYFPHFNNKNSETSGTAKNARIMRKLSPFQQNLALNGSRKSTSKAKSQFNYSRNGNFNYQISIKHRIQKACTTNNDSDLAKENNLLMKQIDKLEKQLLKKDQQIIGMRTKNTTNKETEILIIELYRALNFYQGKISQMENEYQKFQQMILKSSAQGVTTQNLGVLFEDLRKHNEYLAGQLNQVIYSKQKLQSEYNKLEVKHFDCQRELSQYKRRQVSPLYQYYVETGAPIRTTGNPKLNMLYNQILTKNPPNEMELKQKEVKLKQMEAIVQSCARRQNEIEAINSQRAKQIQQLNSYVKELMIDLKSKDEQITQLFKQNTNYKRSLRKFESQISQPQTEKYTKSSQIVSWRPSFKAHEKYGYEQR